jgi:MoxR-like ATPase
MGNICRRQPARLHYQAGHLHPRAPDLTLGASPRASLALFKASQALAAVRGRDHVIPDDIQYLAPAILTHRLLLAPEAELRGRTPKGVLDDLLERTPLEIGKLD